MVSIPESTTKLKFLLIVLQKELFSSPWNQNNKDLMIVMKKKNLITFIQFIKSEQCRKYITKEYY